MDRRGFLLAAGGALVAPAFACAQPADVMALYYDRLKRGLDDAGGGDFVDLTENHLLAEHNGFRHAHGIGALVRSSVLDDAARAHVADLLRRDYFEHASPEGFTSEHRVGLLARRFVGAAGENIAMQDGGETQPGAAEFAKMWRDSPGHRANMLRPDYTHVGFGVVAKGDRTIAGTVFGQTYAELAAPAPFLIRRGEELSGVLDGAVPSLAGYELQPVDGGESVGPFEVARAPQRLRPGAYAIRPHVPDLTVPSRYWVLFGPIVVAA